MSVVTDTLVATLQDTTRLVHDGLHNAFPGLIFWQGWYYLAYRQAMAHNPVTPGKIVVLRSPDACSWRPCTEFATGGDDRDPTFVAGPDELLCIFGTYYPRWQGGDATRRLQNAVMDLISHVSRTKDGVTWMTPLQVFRPNYWLWSAFYDTEATRYMGAAYHVGEEGDIQSITLLTSIDGIMWRHVRHLLEDRWISEPCLFLDGHGNMACVVRHGDISTAYLLTSTLEDAKDQDINGRDDGPYRAWRTHDLEMVVHSPAAVHVHGETVLVCGRTMDCAANGNDKKPFFAKKKHRTKLSDETWWNRHYGMALWELTEVRTLRRVLDFPSAGDCAYPSMVYDAERQQLLVAYYSQHAYSKDERKQAFPVPADIYLARVQIG